ncbi:hypothetical protein GCM10010324_14680 [Streptomyces hiroshimensis]|uniref:Uncharacterized protein n=1 Tax=Streptomyces hiroshimensis TaxID=66424 RepID=A0ABQ2Y7E7_9ACTN|nr:hypothetical protein GCM10010324_14680 [Streptomyces hiroshimensis]
MPAHQTRLPRAAASRASSSPAGTHHTQWCDQEMGLTSSAVAAQDRAPQAAARGPDSCVRTATVRPSTVTATAVTAHHGPGSPVCSNRARTPRSDWLAVPSA